MLEQSAIIAFAVLFIHCATREGMLLGKVAYYFGDAPDWMKMPLYECPVCMTPWWGTWFLFCGWFVGDISMTIYQTIMTLLCAGGINSIVMYVFSIYGQYLPLNKDEE